MGNLLFHSHRTNQRMEKRITDLPNDIITLILISLPIKTIVQLKCLNKYFKQVISSPEFSKIHLKFATQHDSSPYTVIANDGVNEGRIMQLHLTASRPHHQFTGASDVEYYKYYGVYHKLNGQPPGRVVGSCHGLICSSITSTKHCVLWNPCVVDGTEIMFNKLSPPYDCLDIMYALGYDSIEDDYKVVAFCVFEKQHQEQEQQADGYYSVPMVFSLKRNSWNKIGATSFGGVVDSHAKFVNGKIYWLMDTKYSKDTDAWRHVVYFEEREIVCFDVHKEVLETVEQPCYGGSGAFGLALGEVNGSIAVICQSELKCTGTRDRYADIWIMKKDEKRSCSWTKFGTPPRTFSRVRSCCTLPEGAILLFSGYALEFYHPQCNKCWRDVVKGLYYFDSSYHFQPVVYVENLVSPFSLGD